MHGADAIVFGSKREALQTLVYVVSFTWKMNSEYEKQRMIPRSRDIVS